MLGKKAYAHIPHDYIVKIFMRAREKLAGNAETLFAASFSLRFCVALANLLSKLWIFLADALSGLAHSFGMAVLHFLVAHGVILLDCGDPVPHILRVPVCAVPLVRLTVGLPVLPRLLVPCCAFRWPSPWSILLRRLREARLRKENRCIRCLACCDAPLHLCHRNAWWDYPPRDRHLLPTPRRRLQNVLDGAPVDKLHQENAAASSNGAISHASFCQRHNSIKAVERGGFARPLC